MPFFPLARKDAILSNFLYAIFRFRKSANPKADYVGVKSHASSWLEVGVALVEAYKKQNTGISFILLDIIMPKMDGYQVFKRWVNLFLIPKGSKRNKSV